METQKVGADSNTKNPENSNKTGLEDLDIFGGPAKPQPPVKNPQPVKTTSGGNQDILSLDIFGDSPGKNPKPQSNQVAMSKTSSNSMPNDLFSMDLLGGDQPQAKPQQNPVINSTPAMNSNGNNLLDNNTNDLLGNNVEDSNKNNEDFDFDDFEDEKPKEEQPA